MLEVQTRTVAAITTTAPSTPEGLGLISATALVVGHTIAVGIFLTPAEIVGALASPALTLGLWLACGALILAGALTFGELVARYPRAGGPYVYLREGWGERIAFLYGWQAVLIMDPGVTAALATGLAEYVTVVWPAAAGSEKLVAIAAIWMVTLLAMTGLTQSARALGLLTALKLLAVVGIVAAALTIGNGSWSNLAPFVERRSGAPPLVEALALGLVGTFFSFGGFWEASRVAGEIRNPGRTLPLALALGVTCVTFVYVLTSIAFMYLVPAEHATSAAEFARRAGEAVLGPAGPAVFASVVVISVAASALALVMMAPRVYVAMSLDGLFPSALAAVRPGTGTPARAMLLLAALASGFVLAGTFQQIVAFFICTALSFIALAAAALFVARRRAPDATVFRCPGYPLVPLLFVLLIVAVVVLVLMARPIEALAGAAIVLLGLPARRLLLKAPGVDNR
jgi:APA family basic amino acid/polyamine antiporter